VLSRDVFCTGGSDPEELAVLRGESVKGANAIGSIPVGVPWLQLVPEGGTAIGSIPVGHTLHGLLYLV